MSDKFKNKYRIPSARLQNWDYGANATYFITICTKNREHFFGKIIPSAETQYIASLPSQKNKFGPQSQNLASVIRGFKIGVTKFAKNNDIDFAWQPRFHDHIIRDEPSFLQIRNYIINNPENWKDDKFYS